MAKALYRQGMQLSLIWVLIALVPLGRAYINFAYGIAFYTIILIAGVVIAIPLIIWIKFLQAKKLRWAVIIIIQLIFAIGLSLAFNYAAGEDSSNTKMRVNKQMLEQMSTLHSLSLHFLSGNSYTVFSSVMMLTGLALLIEYNEQLHTRRDRESQLQVDLALSQVKALQAELEPHFIFNTLHSVNSLMQFDKPRAEQLIEQFSILLRDYLDIIDRRFYTLEEEMQFLQDYIQVQRLRHGCSIEVAFYIPPACMAMLVPVILLQPVVENSIKHGWVNRQAPLKISITATYIDAGLQLNVSDNGSGDKATGKKGIGIRNLKGRLQLLYASAFTYAENSGENGYSTQITIPWQAQKQ